MKRELKVGDRVAVYGVNGGVTWRQVGVILDWGPQSAKVEFPGGRPYDIVHPKQCRRLIRRERRRWEGEWSEIYMSDGTPRMVFIVAVGAADLPRIGQRMTLVEARPRKERGK